MNSCVCIVLAAALAAPPAPTQSEASFAALETRMHDHVEERRYETLAYEAEAAFKRRDLTPTQRRQMAFFAVQGLHGTYEIVRQSAGLCRALGILRAVERQGRLGASDRGTAERLRTITEGHLAASGLKKPCDRPRTSPPAPAPVTAEAAPPAVSAPVADDLLLPVSGNAAQAPARAPAPAPVLASAPALAATSPVVEGPAPAPAPVLEDRRATRRTTALLATGSVFMAVGVGMVAGMGKYLYDAKLDDDAIKDIIARYKAEGRKPTEEEKAQALVHSRDHEFHTAYAAIAAGGAVVCFAAGIAMLVAAPRRARLAARPWGGPSSVGVTLGGRF